MIIGKITVEDIEKLIKTIRQSRHAAYITVSIDGPKIKFSFTGDDGRLVTVTLYDSDMKIAPTLTRTESL